MSGMPICCCPPPSSIPPLPPAAKSAAWHYAPATKSASKAAPTRANPPRSITSRLSRKTSEPWRRGARTPACRITTHRDASALLALQASARMPTRHAGLRAPRASLRRKRRIHRESFVVAVRNAQALALRAGAELQCIVGQRVNREPILAVNRLAHRGEAGKQVFALGRPDLRHGLPFDAHNVELFLVRPDQPVEKPLPLQNLPWFHLQYPAVHAIHGLIAAALGLVVPQAVLGQHQRLNIAKVAKVLWRQLQVREPLLRLADQHLGALLLRRENNVSHLHQRSAGCLDRRVRRRQNRIQSPPWDVSCAGRRGSNRDCG